MATWAFYMLSAMIHDAMAHATCRAPNCTSIAKLSPGKDETKRRRSYPAIPPRFATNLVVHDPLGVLRSQMKLWK